MSDRVRSNKRVEAGEGHLCGNTKLIVDDR
jgi:hypothetical protein